VLPDVELGGADEVADVLDHHQVELVERQPGERTEAGRRLPLTPAMLLRDSSGVHRDAALEEHRAAIRSVLDAAALAGADPLAVACALDWLLYDRLTGHRDDPDGAAVTIPAHRPADADLVVDAAAGSVAARATVDPGLLTAPRAAQP
jgi:hypothetical protein